MSNALILNRLAELRPTKKTALKLALFGFSLIVPALILFGGDALAQSITMDMGQDGSMTGRVLQMILLLTILSLAPSILIVVTSFTRIVVVLSLLRNALGTQQTPPKMVLVSLALFLTAFIMAPTFEAAYNAGIEPLMEERMDEADALAAAAEPFRTFMMANVRADDLALFSELAAGGVEAAGQPTEQLDTQTAVDNAALNAVPYTVLVPAFMISELRRAFEIGFLIYIPFLVIDMVVASILMSMGMMMLPPVMISLPFKLIFFVLVDGWNLIAGSLVQSFPQVVP